MQIDVDKSDVEFDCNENDTILRAALRAGYGFPYECNVGSCGNCKFQLLEGEIINNSDDASGLSEKDKTRSRYLGCQARPGKNCKVKVRFNDMYKSVQQPQKLQGTLSRVTDITHDIKEFVFSMNIHAPFNPGQYALLDIPGIKHQRAYSMSNLTNDINEWSFQIKRVPAGLGSNKLFDQVAIGETLAFDGPYGMAYLRESAPRDILLIAGGSGLAPMVSIARGVASNPKLAGRKVHFIYGGRTPKDICGEEFLAELPGYNDDIKFYPVISDLEHESSKNWEGATGFVHQVTAALFTGKLADFEIYFAGPPPMAEALQQMLYEQKVPSDQIHFDKFY